MAGQGGGGQGGPGLVPWEDELQLEASCLACSNTDTWPMGSLAPPQLSLLTKVLLEAWQQLVGADKSKCVINNISVSHKIKMSIIASQNVLYSYI